MEHWIEPQALGDSQRTGYNSPLVELPGMAPAGVQHYVNRPGQLRGNGVALPNQAPPGVQHYVNRPGQLSGVFDTVKSSLPTLLAGAVVGVLAWPWIKKKLKV
jgi:hypothetical protein